MKLLFLNTNIGYGGASKMIVWVANQCASAGHDVTLLTYRDCTVNQVVVSRVKHVHQQLEDINGKVSIFHTIKWLKGFIIEERFDVAVAFLSPSQLRLYFACLGTKTKTLFSQRGDPFSTQKGLKAQLINIVNNWTFTHADELVFQTNQAMAFYGNAIKHKSTVIPNPINPLRRTEIRDGNITKRIVSVGRLDIRQKRQDLLIKAFCRICGKYPDYVLEFYGDGADELNLISMAQGIPQIRFMGKTANVTEAIQSASIFVLSSDFEGIPNALLEAMALGLPCISTDCSPGGAALLIQDKVNGILTKRGDVDELAKAMKFLLDNHEQAESLGKEAMAVAEIYSEERIREQWLGLLEKMLPK